MSRNPIRRQVAVVGVGTTPYTRSGGTKSRPHLAAEACIAAVRDAGLRPADINGLVGNTLQASPQNVQEGLGIPALTWWAGALLPFSLSFTEAANAVFSGACNTAIAYQGQRRTSSTSRTAGAGDALHGLPDTGKQVDHHLHEQYFIPYGNRHTTYAGFMRRYMHEHGAQREDFGRIAINSRTNAMRNEHATLREPLTMDDYLAGRMVRDPMCVYDMDYAVDGGDALVLTTAERARDLVENPVYIEAISFGQQVHNELDTYANIETVGQTIAAPSLFAKTDLGVHDIDVAELYDGFSIITMKWLESLGFCEAGQGPAFVKDSWDPSENRLKLAGRVPLNTHGGSLSEGATQGGGHLREAVVQLQHRAGDRQVPGASVAVVTIGGLFFNSTCLLLTREPA